MLNFSIQKERIYALCLIAILIFSAFLYFYRLGNESLTTDEYFSLHVARQPLNAIIFGHEKTSNPNTIPPLYEIIMHFWLNVFGASEFAQRSLSAVFGIMSVYMLYRLARLLLDTQTGLLASLFGSFSFSWFCFFRQNRCYGLFIFLVLLSFYVFFYYLKNKGSKFSFVALIAVNIALIYTHYFSFFVIFLEVLFSIFEWKQNKQWTQSIIFMCFWLCIAYAPWYPNLFYDFTREPIFAKKTYYPDFWEKLIGLLTLLFFDFHFRWNPMLTALYLPLITAGIIKLSKEKADYSRYRFLHLVLILAIPLIIIFSVSGSDRVRYYAPFFFTISIFLACGVRKIAELNLKRTVLLIICAFIIGVNAADFYDFFHFPINENWRLAAKYVKEIPDYRNKQMIFIFQTPYNPPVFAYYYWGERAAGSFVENIPNPKDYEKDMSALKTKHKVYVTSKMHQIGDFFEMLDSLPDNAWIWVFMYRNRFFTSSFKRHNNGRYFFHQITINKEIPQIDFYLIKKIGR